MVATALLMGFAGSLHCVGMCSPLAMAVSNLNRGVVLNRFVYNAGRIVTYGLLGLLLGQIGAALPIAKYQNFLSVLLGFTLLVLAVAGVNNLRVPLLTKGLQVLSAYLKVIFSQFIQRKRYSSIFLLGALNGLLPCGLTFIALAYSLTLGSPIMSFYHMLIFGIGTLPVMLGLASLFQFAVKKYNLNFRKLSTTLLIISGCLLIARVMLSNHAHPSPEEQHVVDIVLCR